MNAWMLEFVPARTRGAYNARRLTVTLLVTSALSLVAGWLLDSFEVDYMAFGVVVLLAVLSAIPEIVLLRRIAALPEPAPSTRSRAQLRVALRDRGFMTLCATVAAFYLALLISDSYTLAHLLGNLRLPTTTATLFGLLGTLPQILLLPWWGRRSDRLGHAVILRSAILLFAIETLVWALAGSGAAVAWVPAGFLVAAVANSAFGVAVFARRYELMPADHRVAYEAVFTATTAIAFLIGPALGAVIRQILDTVACPVEFAPVRGAYLLSTLALIVLYAASGGARHPRTREVPRRSCAGVRRPRRRRTQA